MVTVFKKLHRSAVLGHSTNYIFYIVEIFLVDVWKDLSFIQNYQAFNSKRLRRVYQDEGRTDKRTREESMCSFANRKMSQRLKWRKKEIVDKRKQNFSFQLGRITKGNHWSFINNFSKVRPILNSKNTPKQIRRNIHL